MPRLGSLSTPQFQCMDPNKLIPWVELSLACPVSNIAPINIIWTKHNYISEILQQTICRNSFYVNQHRVLLNEKVKGVLYCTKSWWYINTSSSFNYQMENQLEYDNVSPRSIIFFNVSITCNLITMVTLAERLWVEMWLGTLSRVVWALLVIKFTLHCSDFFTIENDNLWKLDLKQCVTTWTLYMPDPEEEKKVMHSNIF